MESESLREECTRRFPIVGSLNWKHTHDWISKVALLKELGASPMLTVQIQGESLLNDGTAIVVYLISSE